MIEISGGVNRTMDFNPSGTNKVEHQVAFNDEDAIAQRRQVRMSRNASQMGMPSERPNPLINRIGEADCTRWTVMRYEFKNAQQIFLSSRQIAQGEISGHGGFAASSRSFAGA